MDHAVNAVEEAYRTARRLTLASVGLSVLLAVLSITAGWLERSTSVVAMGFEFAGDVLASGVILIGMRVASRPADDNHPYGHGRFETLSAFIVGVILALGGASISYHSLQSVGAAHPPPGITAVVALATAIVLRSLMGFVKLRMGRRIRSSAVVADGWNDAVDVLSALAALTAVALTISDPVRFLAADHYGGFAVGIVVVFVGIRVARDASLELADTMPPSAMTQEVSSIAMAVPGVLGVEKVLARKSGLRYHVDLHIEVDAALTVGASHAVAGHVRATLRRELSWVADVIVHVEPAQTK